MACVYVPSTVATRGWRQIRRKAQHQRYCSEVGGRFGDAGANKRGSRLKRTRAGRQDEDEERCAGRRRAQLNEAGDAGGRSRRERSFRPVGEGCRIEVLASGQLEAVGTLGRDARPAWCIRKLASACTFLRREALARYSYRRVEGGRFWGGKLLDWADF